MKDMRVAVKILTFPLLSDEPPESTMSPVMTTSPLTLPPHAAWVPASHATKLYDAGYSFSSSDDEDSSAVDIPSPSSTAPLQIPVDFSQQPHSKYILTICNDLDDDEEEEDFQIVSLEDDHWTIKAILDRHLCVHKHSLPHSLCPYSCPYMDYTSTSYLNTLDLSDISEFEDLMTTSSDEDIPGLDDEIGY